MKHKTGADLTLESSSFGAGVKGLPLSFVQSMLEACAQASGASILCVAASGEIVAYSKQLPELFGVVDTLPPGLQVSQLAMMLEEQQDELLCSLGRLLRVEQTDADCDARMGSCGTADGRMVRWSRCPIGDVGSDAGRVPMYWAFEDVTGEAQMAAALDDAERWLRMFALHSQGILLELNAELRIVGIWASDTSLLGRPDAELHGCSLPEAIGEPQGSQLERRVRMAYESGEYATYEYSVTTAGKARNFEANAARVEGQPLGATILIRDVTDRMRMQVQLQQADRLASVGLLAAGVAHEINNPLGYVLLNLERIEGELRQLQQERPHTSLEGMLRAVQMGLEGCGRVRDIVAKLTTFARSDKSEALALVDVVQALGFAAELAMPEIERRARLVCEFQPVPQVLADEARLGQVFLNLIVNAIQAIPSGDAAKQLVRLATCVDAEGAAVIEVQDSGVGMSAEMLSRIFDPFFTTKDESEGTGLGLSICRGIVTSFGGEIFAESQVGKGSVFRVVLPPVR